MTGRPFRIGRGLSQRQRRKYKVWEKTGSPDFVGGAGVRKAAPVKVTRPDGTVEIIKDTRTYRQRRDASKRGRYRVTADMKRAVLERDKKCQQCGMDKGPFHVDHIRPYSKGGWNVLSNLRLLCAACNMAKGANWNKPEAPTESELFRY